jgi:hypothetical protein
MRTLTLAQHRLTKLSYIKLPSASVAHHEFWTPTGPTRGRSASTGSPSLAAVPGTSRHGLGIALDLGCGVERFGSEG